MKEITLESKIKLYSLDELDDQDRRLVDMAIKATDRSYAHYSHFHVGAAIRLESGREMIGANQENAAYPVCMCAERSAIFAAGAQFPDEPIVAIAIAARNDRGEFTKEPCSPCGSCRQVMLEVEQRYGHKLRILLFGTKGVYALDSIKQLMPLSFVEDCMV